MCIGGSNWEIVSFRLCSCALWMYTYCILMFVLFPISPGGSSTTLIVILEFHNHSNNIKHFVTSKFAADVGQARHKCFSQPNLFLEPWCTIGPKTIQRRFQFTLNLLTNEKASSRNLAM